MSQVYIASATLYNLHAVRRDHMFNVVAHTRWSLMKGLNYLDLTENILVFWKSGHPPRRWSCTRGGHTGRFNCISHASLSASKETIRKPKTPL